jgi:RNA polymerase primary sigma factor
MPTFGRLDGDCMIQDDLWANPKEEFCSPELQSEPTSQHNTVHRSLDKVQPTDTLQISDTTLHLEITHNIVGDPPSTEVSFQLSSIEIEDDLWTIPDNSKMLREKSENCYISSETSSNPEGPACPPSAPTGMPLYDNKYVTDTSLSFEISPSMHQEETIEYDFSLNSLELLDIEAELLLLEQAEEQSQSQRETGHFVTGDQERRRERAPGWLGNCSILYINWVDEEKAQQEALERLGYAGIAMSDTTRSFVIQAARASSLTRRQERQYVTQLVNARAYLFKLSDDPNFDAEREAVKAEVAELERFLVYKMQWVAVKKAVRFLGQGIELDDLIQYGMLGVIQGVQAFDVTRSTRLLVSVNWWVFSLLNRAVANYSRLIVLPSYIHDMLMKVKRQRIPLDRELGRLPTNEELAEALAISPQRLTELLQAERKVYSLNHYIKKEYVCDGYSFQDGEDAFIFGEEHVFQDEIELSSTRQEVEALLSDLNPREIQVLTLRYDLNDEIGGVRTLEEVGQELRVTRERVRQIEDRAFQKILRKFGLAKVRHRKQQKEKDYGNDHSATALLVDLDPEEKQVIALLHDLDGSNGRRQTPEEVAHQLQMTLEQVKCIAERGTQKVRNRLS